METQFLITNNNRKTRKIYSFTFVALLLLIFSSCGGDDDEPTEPKVDAPIAKFTANTTEILEGDTVIFNDISTGNPTSWNWTFGGGTPATSSQQNPCSGILCTPNFLVSANWRSLIYTIISSTNKLNNTNKNM